MTTITAQTILRSRHSQRPEIILSTLLLRYPRWIHAELMTHRAFSRNAASSRAIPVRKLIDDIMMHPAIPLFWGKNQKGMQAAKECDNTVHFTEGSRDHFLTNRMAWIYARDNAVHLAEAFADAGYHKQIVNRLLEPFSHITVLVSATEWTNFLALRDHPDAEPHIQMLAREIRRELDRTDNIQVLQPYRWHLPFSSRQPFDEGLRGRALHEAVNQEIKLSVSCCASTSYKTVDGFDMTMEKAIEIHDKLVGSTPIHASPAEHVAQADERTFEVYRDTKGFRITAPDVWGHLEQHGNFTGFRQYRKMLPGESL